MRRGFFQGSTLLNKLPASSLPKCGACGLYKKCKSPKMPVSGDGRLGVLIVAEAPGKDEDAEGIQLVGESGQLLTKVLKKIGVNMRKDCWLTNALICRPPGNETPTTAQIEYCRPNIIKTLNDLQPRIVILLGKSAVNSVIGHTWKEDTGSISRWVGWRIPDQTLNAWICPTYHPSFLLRSMRGEFGRTGNPVLERTFADHLKAAFELSGRPGSRNYEDEVEILLDHREASRRIKAITETGDPIAFDYECNCLRPETKGARIITCSVSRKGKETIAFPWTKATRKAMGELLRSPCRKRGANLKFEERWTMWEFGQGVRNWDFDIMQAAHILDNRPDITSLKFQAYVLLGAQSYDDHVKVYLKSKHGLNRIVEEIKLTDLLLYNGLDSLLTYDVALKQRRLIFK